MIITVICVIGLILTLMVEKGHGGTVAVMLILGMSVVAFALEVITSVIIMGLFI